MLPNTNWQFHCQLTAQKEVQMTHTKQNKTNYNWIAKMAVTTIQIPGSTNTAQILHRKVSDDPNKRGHLILPMHQMFGACVHVMQHILWWGIAKSFPVTKI
jgi:hypothetical protein